MTFLHHMSVLLRCIATHRNSSQLPPHGPSLFFFDIPCQSRSVLLLLVSGNLLVNLVLILEFWETL